MTNKIREMIEKLEADENRAEGSEKLIQMLKQKEFELGENIPEEVATEVIKKCMLAHLAEKSGNPPEEKKLSEEEIMHRDHVIAAVKEHFDEKGMLYSTLNVSEGNECFELGVRFRGGNFRARVLIEAKRKVCRIDVIYPVTAEPEYSYALCKKIAEKNYPRRFGALQYDTRDGEISYRYSFPTHPQFSKNDFEDIFPLIVVSAAESYETIRKYCVGMFKPLERHEIINEAEKMIEAIKEYEG